PLRDALSKLDVRLVPLFGIAKLSDNQKALRDELARQRRALLATAHQRIADRSAGLVWSQADIQKQIPGDTAVVVWVSALKERWVCLLGQQGDPFWIKLSGNGAKGAWTEEDNLLPTRLYQALADASESAARRERLLAEVRKLWLDPVVETLKTSKALAG